MNKKIATISNLFEGKEIRSVWNAEKEDYYFSVVDVIEILTNSENPRNYWNMLKRRLSEAEQSELYTKCVQLKMKSKKDGKNYLTDTLDTKGILRLIESVPSPKAEPFKLWLASLGKERIDEVFDPEIAINRAVDYYRKKGYSDNWIEARLKGNIILAKSGGEIASITRKKIENKIGKSIVSNKNNLNYEYIGKYIKIE